MRHLLFVLILFIGLFPASRGQSEGDRPSSGRPNILWLTAEDMSPHLGCYGDTESRTPRLDALANEAIRFDRAFATAPVCSPSRSCLITGMYATSLGTQRLRSQFPVPSTLVPFTVRLRAAGYYCTNNVKTDYNVRDESEFIRAAWDDSSTKAHWRNREADQPFFAVFNYMTTHQSRTSAWSHDEFEKEVGSQLSWADRHRPAGLSLPPFYPDTLEARRAWGRYRDCVTLMDRQVGVTLDELAEDSLTENTIVFFYSDHGMGMPRGKRCLANSGLHVPLLVRFPKKWGHLAPGPSGGSTARLVSFVDFAPTILKLCGLESPSYFQGSPFLGQDVGGTRRYVFGARDRVDEAFDVARSVHDGRWLYIRNFMPHLSWMQPEAYSDTSTFRREFQRLAAEGKLEAGPLTYAAERRAIEELYDTQADPHQIHNLASRTEHQVQLERLRVELRRWQFETRDAGFLTEPEMRLRIGKIGTPREVACDDQQYPLALLLEVADSVGREASAPRQRAWLLHADAGVRYWAAVGLNAQTRRDDADRESLRKALQDESPVVRIEAAAALVRDGDLKLAFPVLIAALRHEANDVVLHAARALELLGPFAHREESAMRTALAAAREAEQQGDPLAMYIRFSLESTLQP